MAQSKTKYYMVRAMAQKEADFKLFFDHSVIAVGWSEVDFTAFKSVEELIQQVDKIYYGPDQVAPQVAGIKRNEVRRFVGIRPGDRIVIPYYSSIRLATATNEVLYDDSVRETLDLSNQHRVTYLRQDGEFVTIPRSSLTTRLQTRLRVPGSTVRDLDDFGQELGRLFEALGAGTLDTTLGWPATLTDDRHRQEEDFKNQLLRNIQEGKTNLQAGGIGLERLVRDLLETEGYEARVMSKRQFPGFADADVSASKDDRILGVTKILVQVKHHSGSSGAFGAVQLTKILDDDLFAEHRLMLVTSGQASHALKDMCDNHPIILMDGKALVDWIFDALPLLPSKTIESLGIINVPSLKE